MIKRKEIVNLFLNEKKNKSLDNAINDVIENISTSSTRKINKSQISKFKYEFNQKWKKCSRNKKLFLKRHDNWLNEEIKIFIEDENKPKLKKRDIINKAKSAKCDKLISDTINQLKKNGNYDVAQIIEIACSTKNKAAKILKTISNNTIEDRDFTPREALSSIIELNLSAAKYKILRRKHIDKNNNIYPPYYKVQQEKKKCYPPTIHLSESSISIKLQDLINHTTTRLLSNENNNIKDYKINNNNNEKLNAILLFKYGFDGSSNHSLYNIKKREEMEEANLISIFLCPLKLYVEDDKTIIWKNKCPNSPKFCRPLRLLHMAETKENLKSIYDDLKKEIDLLEDLEICNITVKFKSILTMLDGKAIKAIMGDSSPSVCKICMPPTTPKEMNNINSIENKNINEQYLEFGLSPLHLWINTLDCMLHISYRIKLKCWAVRGESNKQKMYEEKKEYKKN